MQGTCQKAATVTSCRKRKGLESEDEECKNTSKRGGEGRVKDGQSCRGKRRPGVRLLDAGYYIGNTVEDKVGQLQMGGGAECTG